MAKENFNYTPLPTFKTASEKAPFRIPTKAIAGLIAILVVAVGLVGYLISLQEPIQTSVPAAVPSEPPQARVSPSPQVSPTRALALLPTSNPSPSPTVAPSVSPSPIPVACGTKLCDDTTNPCRGGLVCVAANDGAKYCADPEFQNACIANPSQSTCCTAQAETPTPTEILLAQAPTEKPSTTSAGTTEIPEAGIAGFARLFAIISAAVILLGLVL